MHKIAPSVYFLAFVVYIFFFLLMPQKGMNYDMQCWGQWSAYIFEHGLGKVYDSGANYLPGHLYELKLYTLLFNSKQGVIDHIYYTKYFTLLFDVAGALLVCSLVKSPSEQRMAILILMLNPAYLHNTMAWGQFDSVFSCLIFASFLATCRRNYLLAALLYLLSLNFKFQGIVFLPAFALFVVHQLENFKINWRLIVRGALLLIIIQIIILIPFIANSSAIMVWKVMKSYSSYYNYISLNAANVWQLLLTGDLRWTTDTITFGGMTYKTWGSIMFVTMLLTSLLPFIRSFLFKVMKKTITIQLPELLLIFSLFPLAFFYFNTQMHERYSYPAFLFIAGYALLTNRWWVYLLFSVAYFMNVDKVLRSLTLINYDAPVFDLQFISLLFLALIISLLALLFSGNSKRFIPLN